MSTDKKLPKKEADLFKQVVNCYESKQYKKGITIADLILKKVPDHGETQAMKGLIYNYMGKKDQSFELIKTGLRNDVKSHICWHVFGLYHRNDNNYQEAMKCYLNALRIDSNNQNILRDLSWLQIQTREINGFLTSRNKILDTKPNLRTSWIASAVANYLSEHYQTAFDVISRYRLRPDAERSDGYEDSELYLFQTDCLIKQSKYEEAIKFLKRSEDSIVDMLSHKVKLAELYVLSGKFNEARTSWTHLVLEQPDNYRFHCGLQVSYLELDPTTSLEMFSLKKLQLPSTTLQLSKEQMVVLKDMYVASNFKTRNVSKILLTVCCDRDELKVALDKHLRSSLHNAMPALYHDIFSLVSIPDPVNQSSHVVFASDPIDIKQHEVILITRELVDKYISNLRSHEQFEDLYDPSLPLEPPTSFLWALYLKAHILEMCNELKEALVVIDESIQHTPTAIDMYCKKARILKKLGDIITAAVVIDDCRMLDLQDRYLNNKATKYYLRIDETELAMNTIALFVKHDGEPQKILYDLQCNWYELEVGESLARTKQWGGALRKFHAIKKHFFDYVHDMIDFHSYCVRKTTIRAYFDVLKFQNEIYSHKYFQRALRGALRIFLHLVDCPEDIDGLGHLPPLERKKKREKLKKAKKKAEEDAKKVAEENGLKADHTAEGNKKEESAPQPDEDFYLAKDFLVEGLEWCHLLVTTNTVATTVILQSCSCETISLVSDMFARRGEYVQALDALTVGLKINKLDPYLVYSLVRIAIKIKSPGKKSIGNSEMVAKIKLSLNTLLESDLNIESYVNNYRLAVKDQNSFLHLLSILKCQYLLDKEKVPLIVNELMFNGTVDLFEIGRDRTMFNAIEIYKFLIQHYPDHDVTKLYQSKVESYYPDATMFGIKKTVTVLRAEDSAVKEAVNKNSNDNETEKSTM